MSTAVLEKLQEMEKGLTSLKEQNASLAKQNADLGAKLEAASKPQYPAGAKPSDVFGVPGVRQGENPLGSRGFSFMKMAGLVSRQIDPAKCKVELEVAGWLKKALSDDLGNGGYPFKSPSNVLCPIGSSFLPEDMVDAKMRHEIKSVVAAGVSGADLDEVAWWQRRLGGEYAKKDMSWITETSGGSLVAPPDMGEIIPLLRNKEALVRAGARVVPLPPQGRIVYPAVKAASATYWLGEGGPATASDLGTGEAILSAKKLVVLIKTNNELLRFASPAAEALFRDDMAKSLALGLDLAALEGVGSSNSPLGIINRTNISTILSSTQGANGDTIVPQDIYRMLSQLEENNVDIEAEGGAFIMRPKTYYNFIQKRWDTISAGDQAGGFIFALTRGAQEGFKRELAGLPVVTSTQVSRSRVKNSGTNLTYILAGMFSDVLLGMFGAIEFAATAQGDTSFANDQTWIRGILTADSTTRHDSAFCLLDKLIMQ